MGDDRMPRLEDMAAVPDGFCMGKQCNYWGPRLAFPHADPSEPNRNLCPKCVRTCVRILGHLLDHGPSTVDEIVDGLDDSKGEGDG